MQPGDTLPKHFRLTPPQQQALRKLGISTILDLLYHFPVRYDRGGEESPIAGLAAGQEATVFGTIKKLDTRRSWKRRIPIGEGVIEDGSGTIKILWFHQPYLAKKFPEGTFVKAVGQIGGSGDKLYLANPHVEPADPADAGLFSRTEKPARDREFFAVYPESRGITSLWLRHAIARVLKSGALESVMDPIPSDTLEKYKLPAVQAALRYIHAPEELRHAEAARKRFSFEEIFAIQVARAIERAQNDAQRSFSVPNADAAAETFLRSIPFLPTAAQKRAIADICADFCRGAPMARLLEGDVGSGKTLVAAAASYAVVTSRPPNRESGTLQVAYMAPTEILAQQHFESFIGYFRDLPINIGLITGSGCKKFPSKSSPGSATNISRAQFLKWVGNGEIALVIGTHALIQKSVKFQHLAYAIVDEQHRFGTRQRRELAQKNAVDGAERTGTVSANSVLIATRTPLTTAKSALGGSNVSRARFAKTVPVRSAAQTLPHFLSMTATPIPRTLALTIYGDLDISVLDELPPGRAKIATRIVPNKDRASAYETIRAELGKGRQAYVICPRIDEPDPEKQNAIQAKSVKAESVRLKKVVFPEFKIGLLHGAMKPKEKDDVMRDFSAGKIDVLVATSVVEVGVNVPNATCIVIEGAERFGLSQLHQLRGRVMRSSHPPLCFLFAGSKSDLSLKRLRALAGTDDGFKLAEADLENRGAGDLFGRSQWGVSDIGMEALKNPRLIAAARDEAQKLVSHDSSLSTALATRVQKITGELHGE